MSVLCGQYSPLSPMKNETESVFRYVSENSEQTHNHNVYKLSAKKKIKSVFAYFTCDQHCSKRK